METVVLRNGLVKSSVGNSIMLYDVKNENFYAFNGIASMIIDLMGYNLSIEKIKSTIKEYYKVTDQGAYSADFDNFIKDLGTLEFLIKTNIVNNTYTQCDFTNVSEYEKPSYKSYTKAWLLEHHPGTFYNLCFSDRWGPSGPVDHGPNP